MHRVMKAAQAVSMTIGLLRSGVFGSAFSPRYRIMLGYLALCEWHILAGDFSTAWRLGRHIEHEVVHNESS